MPCWPSWKFSGKGMEESVQSRAGWGCPAIPPGHATIPSEKVTLIFHLATVCCKIASAGLALPPVDSSVPLKRICSGHSKASSQGDSM